VTCITLLEVTVELLIIPIEATLVSIGLLVAPLVTLAALLRLENVLDVVGATVDAPMTMHILDFIQMHVGHETHCLQ
jgi:hypothetical protein